MNTWIVNLKVQIYRVFMVPEIELRASFMPNTPSTTELHHKSPLKIWPIISVCKSVLRLSKEASIEQGARVGVRVDEVELDVL